MLARAACCAMVCRGEFRCSMPGPRANAPTAVGVDSCCHPHSGSASILALCSICRLQTVWKRCAGTMSQQLPAPRLAQRPGSAQAHGHTVAEAPAITGAERRRQKRERAEEKLKQEHPAEFARVQAHRQKTAPFRWDKYALTAAAPRFGRSWHELL